MSDEQDKESKTELPTEQRKKDSRERGNVPFSTEVGTLGMLASTLAILMLVVDESFGRLVAALRGILANSGTIALEPGGDSGELLTYVFWSYGNALLPVFAIFVVGGIIGPLGQNVPLGTLERVAPKLERLSPRQNIDRIFGRRGIMEFAKNLLKVLVVGLVCFFALRGRFSELVFATSADPIQLPKFLCNLLIAIVAPLTLLALLISVVDLIFVSIQWSRDLMMTRQEVKDEHKRTEGDPLIKERIKLLGRQRLKRRMMSDLQRATLVVANPTHFAVAMRYVAEEGGAPVVVAKGIDHLALRIRGDCEKMSIPVVENKPLARSLYSAVQVGQMIPPDYYRAVAEVIHYVEYRKRLASRARSQA